MASWDDFPAVATAPQEGWDKFPKVEDDPWSKFPAADAPPPKPESPTPASDKALSETPKSFGERLDAAVLPDWAKQFDVMAQHGIRRALNLPLSQPPTGQDLMESARQVPRDLLEPFKQAEAQLPDKPLVSPETVKTVRSALGGDISDKALAQLTGHPEQQQAIRDWFGNTISGFTSPQAAGAVAEFANPIGRIGNALDVVFNSPELFQRAKQAYQTGDVPAALSTLMDASRALPVIHDVPKIGGELNAIERSNAQVQARETPLGVETRPEGQIPKPSDSDNVIGKTQGTQQPIVAGTPQETPQPVTVYHGTPYEIPSFSFERAGAETNRGGTSFGLGINLTEDIGHAKAYAGKGGNVYSVDIPKSDLGSFISWENPVPKNISSELPEIDLEKPIPFGGGATIENVGGQWKLQTGTASFPLRESEVTRMFGDANTGEQAYRKLVASLGSERAASQWLLQKGIKGITNVTERGVPNYTVFDPSILTIKGKVSPVPEVGQAPVVSGGKPEPPAAPTLTSPESADVGAVPVPIVADEPHVSAIANRFIKERADRGELGQITPGRGFSRDDLVFQGLKMPPEEINQHVSDLMQGTGDIVKQGQAVRVEEARLTQRSNKLSKVADADPKNVEARLAADNAFKDLEDFHNGPVAQLKQKWHATGLEMQGEIPVDLSTYNGLRQQWLRDVGEAPPAKVEPELRRTAQNVSKAIEEDNGARSKLSQAIDKESTRRKYPTADEVRNNIRERMGLEPCRI